MQGEASLQFEINRLKAKMGSPGAAKVLTEIRRQPWRLMEMNGCPPDPWQRRILESFPVNRLILNCARGSGKSELTAALSLLTAWFLGKVIIVATTLLQAQELLRKVKRLNDAAGRPLQVTSETTTCIEFVGGSRVLCLCSNEASVLGHHEVKLLVIDEASRVSDEIYDATLPMRMTAKGGIVLLSTPNTRSGFFFKEWTEGENWERVLVTSDMCPRLDPADVEQYRRSRGDRRWRTEFRGEFASTEEFCIFRPEDLQSMCRGTEPALFED